MTRQEKIQLILDARPRLVHIIKCANDEQLDRLVEEVKLSKINENIIEMKKEAQQ